MVYGTLDLSIFPKEIDTNQGFDAGWAVLEHILSKSEYSEIPILIFSSRKISESNIELIAKLNKQRKGRIDYIEKSSTQHDILKWLQDMSRDRLTRHFSGRKKPRR